MGAEESDAHAPGGDDLVIEVQNPLPPRATYLSRMAAFDLIGEGASIGDAIQDLIRQFDVAVQSLQNGRSPSSPHAEASHLFADVPPTHG